MLLHSMLTNMVGSRILPQSIGLDTINTLDIDVERRYPDASRIPNWESFSSGLSLVGMCILLASIIKAMWPHSKCHTSRRVSALCDILTLLKPEWDDVI